MTKKTKEFVKRLGRQFSGPMSAHEEEFLRDIQGSIEFALRNGVNFAVIASALCHDLNEVARDGFDLGQAMSRGFLPKVAEYRKISTDDFGEPEETN